MSRMPKEIFSELRKMPGNEVIKVKDLCKKYDDKILFEDAEMLINFKERATITKFLRLIKRSTKTQQRNISAHPWVR